MVNKPGFYRPIARVVHFAVVLTLVHVTFYVAYAIHSHVRAKPWHAITLQGLYRFAPPWFETCDEVSGRILSNAFFLLSAFGVSLLAALTPVVLLAAMRNSHWKGGRTHLERAVSRSPHLARVMARAVVALVAGICAFPLADSTFRSSYPTWIYSHEPTRWVLRTEPEWVGSRAWLENDIVTCVKLAPVYALPLAVATLTAYIIASRRRVRPSDGIPRCARCGYNLSGLTATRCPECGDPFPDPATGDQTMTKGSH